MIRRWRCYGLWKGSMLVVATYGIRHYVVVTDGGPRTSSFSGRIMDDGGHQSLRFGWNFTGLLSFLERLGSELPALLEVALAFCPW
ncbi:hypothetical protein DVH24_015584 [Malus domestica]|uniref:Uncharacterized protein n=1 Tax=Malus domestica TaxID=3750 RepID=A0A498HM17_MALDO|nr:hypothetical protein DVH24_015584 [Malus domestica]